MDIMTVKQKEKNPWTTQKKSSTKHLILNQQCSFVFKPPRSEGHLLEYLVLKLQQKCHPSGESVRYFLY